MVKEETKHYTNVTQIMALNYGSREEIVRAVSRLNRKGEEVTEESLSRELDSPYSDIDLLIRTSGEQRISNFLMWQISYAELFFTDTLWPDFTPRELEQIIAQFIDRDRRFGGV